MLNSALTRTRRHHPALHSLSSDPFFSFVDRLFGEMAPTSGSNGDMDRRWVPAMDIVEHEDSFVATADLPGLTKDDIDISLEDGVLTISGERKFESSEEEGKVVRRLERVYGSFSRAFTMPQGVDAEKVDASFTNGVLTLTLPKSEGARSRKIAIS